MFEILGTIVGIETFARGSSIRELPRLRKLYGDGQWRKCEGIANVRLANDRIRKAEPHCTKPPVSEDQRFCRLSMAVRTNGFAVCLRNGGFAASLEPRKLYPFIHDPEAEENDLIRVVDESGEDYLYPARLFRKLALPGDARRALRLAS